MAEAKGVSLEQVREYLKLEEQIAELEAKRDIEYARLLTAALTEGSISARGTKTTILRVEKYELIATRGQSIEVDEKAANLLLVKCGRRVFSKLFRVVEKYVVAKGAAKLIASKQLPVRVRALYGEAVNVTDKKPSLRVVDTELKAGKKAA